MKISGDDAAFNYKIDPTVANASSYLGAMRSALFRYEEFVELRRTPGFRRHAADEPATPFSNGL